jgi:hypothetical protein
VKSIAPSGIPQRFGVPAAFGNVTGTFDRRDSMRRADGLA